MEGVGPDNPPAGSISHERDVVDGQIVIIEEWESKEAQQAFINNIGIPAMKKSGLDIAMPEIVEL